MKLIATYVHNDHTTTKDHGEYENYEAYERNGHVWHKFVFEGYEVEWSDKRLTKIEHVGDETRAIIDWRE